MFVVFVLENNYFVWYNVLLKKEALYESCAFGRRFWYKNFRRKSFKTETMIEIGGKPILWHIMKLYSQYNYNEFVICCGYKAHMIKEYFANYYLHSSDVTFDFANNNDMILHNNFAEPWKITLVDTGLNTMTGGRIKRVQNILEMNLLC